MMKLCWATQPASRPNITDVFECLDQVSKTWKPPSPQVDEGVSEMVEDDWDITLTVNDPSYNDPCLTQPVLIALPTLSRIDSIGPLNAFITEAGVAPRHFEVQLSEKRPMFHTVFVVHSLDSRDYEPFRPVGNSYTTLEPPSGSVKADAVAPTSGLV